MYAAMECDELQPGVLRVLANIVVCLLLSPGIGCGGQEGF